MKEFYTEGELAELMKREQNRVALNEEEGRPTEPVTADDVHYDFSQFGLDRGQTKLSLYITQPNCSFLAPSSPKPIRKHLAV